MEMDEEIMELEALNRKVDERFSESVHLVWEHEKKAEMRRNEEARKVNGILNMIGTMIISGAVIAASAALYMTESVSLWFAVALGGLTGLISAFRFGYLWHEIKSWED